MKPGVHPQDASPYLASDIYRVTVTAEGRGWAADVPNALIAVKAGESARIPVHVTRGSGSGKVTLVAVSESDPKQRSDVTYDVR
jgi:hypothetical protein